LAVDGNGLRFHLTIAVESTGKAQRPPGNRLRQAVAGIAADAEIAGRGQKTVVVITVAFGLTGIGETGNIKVIVISIAQ